jgi:hypothetical protein
MTRLTLLALLVHAGCKLSTGDAPSCVRDQDCGSPNQHCVYKIADGCAATGHCAARPSGPTCASIVLLCGCDGTMVGSGSCQYPDGYAGGPTTGASLCTDGGNPGGSDGGQPCIKDQDCPSNAWLCGYPIADGCAATGRCVARPPGPTCGTIVELCGCNGQPVGSGACRFPDGYASGPTTGGSSSCPDGGH